MWVIFRCIVIYTVLTFELYPSSLKLEPQSIKQIYTCCPWFSLEYKCTKGEKIVRGFLSYRK